MNQNDVMTPWDYQADDEKWIYEKGWKDAIEAAALRVASLSMDEPYPEEMFIRLVKGIRSLTPPKDKAAQ